MGFFSLPHTLTIDNLKNWTFHTKQHAFSEIGQTARAVPGGFPEFK